MNFEAVTIWLMHIGYKIEEVLTSIFDREGNKDKWII